MSQYLLIASDNLSIWKGQRLIRFDPNQELVAIGAPIQSVGVAHIPPLDHFLGRLLNPNLVYVPSCRIFTAVVVIVALYGLTPAFTWIPTAGISAVIIHAVLDLVAKPTQVYSFWRVPPLEFFIWLAAVLVTIFSTIENGIYTSICASLASFSFVSLILVLFSWQSHPASRLAEFGRVS